MDITPYVERLRQDLAQSAAAGNEQIRDAAERLALALDPSMRLALMEALSQAAAEITTEMRSGSVDVRLAGRELEFVVAHPMPAEEAVAAPGPSVEDEDDAATARITLRLPESVKAKAEELATKHGSSLNTWIVNVLRGATREGAINIDIDLSSLPLDGFGPGGKSRGAKRMTGWV
ncbi:toxin-antitoxin system HicB family antitoxin [Nocardioides marmorisolisilvae]|uniref:toxin-antitoxin system HicB family antitoxin n=1 Tax=Nocardioides marmorisolisilvae TaxID=1542737 RepID=UPI001FE7B604|nr:toxin-antitoxin system HicB family antitoxin [Nocardioides marmorisolisilvae]